MIKTTPDLLLFIYFLSLFELSVPSLATRLKLNHIVSSKLEQKSLSCKTLEVSLITIESEALILLSH